MTTYTVLGFVYICIEFVVKVADLTYVLFLGQGWTVGRNLSRLGSHCPLWRANDWHQGIMAYPTLLRPTIGYTTLDMTFAMCQTSALHTEPGLDWPTNVPEDPPVGPSSHTIMYP